MHRSSLGIDAVASRAPADFNLRSGIATLVAGGNASPAGGCARAPGAGVGGAAGVVHLPLVIAALAAPALGRLEPAVIWWCSAMPAFAAGNLPRGCLRPKGWSGSGTSRGARCLECGGSFGASHWSSGDFVRSRCFPLCTVLRLPQRQQVLQATVQHYVDTVEPVVVAPWCGALAWMPHRPRCVAMERSSRRACSPSPTRPPGGCRAPGYRHCRLPTAGSRGRSHAAPAGVGRTQPAVGGPGGSAPAFGPAPR